MTIDLGPQGSAGIEATYRDGVLYIEGSNHAWDWMHHILPGARRRELEAAAEIVDRLPEEPAIIAGHSLGGAIAALVGRAYPEARVFVYGGKRAPRGARRDVTAYRHRGDIVPFLPPWRARWRQSTTIGQWDTPWRAHEPRRYYRQMRVDGIQ